MWKKEVPDLRDLTCKQYEHLMHVVDITRDTLIKMLKVKKVYLVYMDEAKHVHWQLVPRYNAAGFDIFTHVPIKTKDFPLSSKFQEHFAKVFASHTKHLE